MVMETFDVVVVGAGCHGITFAKIYHHLHPHQKILIVERAASIGGVWAKERLYPGLKSNNLAGTFEFTDFPLTGNPRFGSLRYGKDYIPGETIHDYFTAYTTDNGISECFRFNTEVVCVERLAHTSDGTVQWEVETISKDGGSVDDKRRFRTAKLVVATGLCSQAISPTFQGDDSPEAPRIIRFKDLPTAGPELLRSLEPSSTDSKTSRSVAVLGGGKSSWDAVYYFASKGIRVDWIVRASGNGPTWMAPSYLTTPWGSKIWIEKIVTRRAVGWFSPSLWHRETGGLLKRFTGWLHGGSQLGRAIVNAFWNGLQDQILTENGLANNAKTLPLVPSASPFWSGTSLSIINYKNPTMRSLIDSDLVAIHKRDILHFSPSTITLSPSSPDQSPVELNNTAALVASTKWLSLIPFNFIPEGSEPTIGIPFALDPSQRNTDPWTERSRRADLELLKRFPQLAIGPTRSASYVALPTNPASSNIADSQLASRPIDQHSKFRLHRFMAPPYLAAEGDRSLVFLGMMLSLNTTTLAEVQALWACAYFADKLDTEYIKPAARAAEESPAERERRKEALLDATALDTQWAQWRYPAGAGRWHPDTVVEGISYISLLLRELGVNDLRKGGGFWKESFSAYGVEDFCGILDEWKEKVGWSE